MGGYGMMGGGGSLAGFPGMPMPLIAAPKVKKPRKPRKPRSPKHESGLLSMQLMMMKEEDSRRSVDKCFIQIIIFISANFLSHFVLSPWFLDRKVEKQLTEYR